MTHQPPLPSRHLMGDRPDWALLGRYLSGECQPVEVELVEHWAKADAANVDLLEFLREIWESPAVTRPPIDKVAAWRALQASIAAATKPAVRPIRVLPTSVSQVSRRRIWLRRALIGAAAAAAAAIAVVVVRWSAVDAPGQQHREQQGHEYATARGQRAELVLVDGTRVWLNADSRLRLRPGYNGAARDVELEGEAYFVVERDDRRPFRVWTHGAVSEDLGTAFNVRSYPEERNLRVVVASGRVAVQRTDTLDGADVGARGPTRVDLAAGQMARLDGAGHLSKVDGVDVEATLAWREGRLKFVEVPLSYALRELERWYDLRIVLEDSSLARVSITATIGPRTADQALAIVTRAIGATYERDDRLVRIRERGDAP